MAKRTASAKRRPRLYVDVPESGGRRIRRTADRFFRGVTNEAVLAALSAFNWMLEQKRQGRHVISVEADALPERFSEAVLPGVDEALGNEDWTWLVRRPHPWRRQLSLKGRRITAGQLADQMGANHWTPEETARQFDLPVEAVLEAGGKRPPPSPPVPGRGPPGEEGAKRGATDPPPAPPRAARRRWETPPRRAPRPP